MENNFLFGIYSLISKIIRTFAKFKKTEIMKVSHVVAFLGGAAVAAGITLLFTTEKGGEIRTKAQKLSKEEIDKIIAKLKKEKEIIEEEVAAEEV